MTIADVAARAGVGAGTVSRVLNESPRVSADTRARVLAAIEALDYRPNPLAQRLSRGRCQTLGAVVPFFTHASAVERLRGVVSGLDGSRYDLVLFNVESPVHRDEHLASLTRRDRADGLLIVSLSAPPTEIDRLLRAGMPIVALDTRAPGVPAVVTDDVEGGRIATRHLLSLGHERIAFIGDALDNPFGFTSSPDRERGCRWRATWCATARTSGPTPATSPRSCSPSGRRRPPCSPPPTRRRSASWRLPVPPASTCPATCPWSASTTSRCRATPG